MRQGHRQLKQEIRPLEMIRAMITDEINQLELRQLEKDADGQELIKQLGNCRLTIGGWINWIYDLR